MIDDCIKKAVELYLIAGFAYSCILEPFIFHKNLTNISYR